MRLFSSRLARGRSRTPRTTLKMAAFAPMPRASVTTTMTVSPLVRIKERNANFKSCQQVMIASVMRVPPSNDFSVSIQRDCDAVIGRRIEAELLRRDCDGDGEVGIGR